MGTLIASVNVSMVAKIDVSKHTVIIILKCSTSKWNRLSNWNYWDTCAHSSKQQLLSYRYHLSRKELMDCLDYLQNMFSLKTIVEPSQVASYHKRVPAHYYLSTR